MDIHLNKSSDNVYMSGYVDDGYDIYAFSTKQFSECSEYGINGGRVSKLSISTGNQGMIVNYDRGWDIRPMTKEDAEVCNTLVDYLEQLPNR